MMDVEKYRAMTNIEELQKMDIFNKFDEFDLRDLCNLMQEPVKNVNACISKGQLKTLCKQLLAENLALRKHIENTPQ